MKHERAKEARDGRRGKEIEGKQTFLKLSQVMSGQVQLFLFASKMEILATAVFRKRKLTYVQ